MKKTIAFALSIILLITILILPASAGNNDYVRIDLTENVELVIENNQLTDRQINRIVSHFNDDTDEIVTYNLICTLFGHNLQYTIANKITHNYYSTSPKCKNDMYSVGTCERCGYTESELISSERIGCH